MYESNLVGHHDICDWVRKRDLHASCKRDIVKSHSVFQAKLDKADEMRLLPLSISWYHADVNKILYPSLEESEQADVLCANLSALQLKKYAVSTDTASGIAVSMLNRVENAADAKAALASVTKEVQQIHEVLNQFLSDEACMLAFVTQFVSGAAGI